MSEPDQKPTGERIAKVLARAGLCSRREAERWIARGRISVDGKVIDSPALNVMPHADILVDGAPLPDRQPTRLWCYHKPTGRLTGPVPNRPWLLVAGNDVRETGKQWRKRYAGSQSQAGRENHDR